VTTDNGDSVAMDTDLGHVYWSSNVNHTIFMAALNGYKPEVVIGKLCTVLYTHALMSWLRSF